MAESVSSTQMLLSTIAFVLLCVLQASYADNCAINFYGTSYVGLSSESTKDISYLSSSIDGTQQYTFEAWAKPSRFVAHEQNLLQSGIINNAEGKTDVDTAWAVEIKLKLTIWQQGNDKPSSSVLYVDVWNLGSERHGVWSKTRYYVILGEENFPWVHAAVTIDNGNAARVMINGKSRRMDKYSPVSLDDVRPTKHFVVGAQFNGAIDETRIWRNNQQQQNADIRTSLCSDDVTSDVLLYLPFNECGGDVFTGYNQDGAICAMTYGSDAIWTFDSPVVTRECTPQSDGQCNNATPMINDDDNNGRHKGGNNGDGSADTETRVLDLQSYHALPFLLVALLLLVVVRSIRNNNYNNNNNNNNNNDKHSINA